ncbi:hypothetical protein J6590_051473 [Homalodisca vitripennis]|nr:hypothetical protein J6590_051473 [Homalodisca vitripennis]
MLYIEVPVEVILYISKKLDHVTTSESTMVSVQILLGKFNTFVQTTKDGVALPCYCRTVREQVLSSFLLLVTHSTEQILPKDTDFVKMLLGSHCVPCCKTAITQQTSLHQMKLQPKCAFSITIKVPCTFCGSSVFYPWSLRQLATDIYLNVCTRLFDAVLDSRQPKLFDAVLDSRQPKLYDAVLDLKKPRLFDAVLDSKQPRLSDAVLDSRQPRLFDAVLDSKQPRLFETVLDLRQPKLSDAVLDSRQPRLFETVLDLRQPKLSDAVLDSRQPRLSDAVLDSRQPRLFDAVLD